MKISLLFLSSNEVFRKAGVSLNRKESSDEDYKERQVTQRRRIAFSAGI